MLRVVTIGTHQPVAGIEVERLECYADAVLYEPPPSRTSRVPGPCTIRAISMIGQEQVIRAISAACSSPKDELRTRLEITGPMGTKVVGRWGGPWRSRVARIDRAVHCVAIPEATMNDAVHGVSEHVVVAYPKGAALATQYDLAAAIYRTLCEHYSTPLAPLDQPGATPEEQEAGRQWCKTLTTKLIQSDTWRRLKVHPDQTDRTWAMSGRLSLTDDALDAFVVELLHSGQLSFPGAVPATRPSPAMTSTPSSRGRGGTSGSVKTPRSRWVTPSSIA